MPEKKSRAVELFAVDILVAAYRIGQYTRRFDGAGAFRQDSLHWDATIRQLEVIGEALNNLLQDEVFSALAPAYFRKVVNFRNVITHGYFGIDETEVWGVATQHLPVPKTDLLAVAGRSGIDLKKALDSEAADLERLGDCKAADCLRKNFKERIKS